MRRDTLTGSTVDAVFFDVDGTLVDHIADWRSAAEVTARMVAERHGISRAKLLGSYYASSEQIWRAIQGAPRWGNIDEPNIILEVWRLALASFPAAGEASVEHAAVTYGHFRSARVSVFPDVPDCLAVLQARYRIGVITNGSDATHRPRIAATGLEDYFASVTTTNCGSGKPLPGIFAHALASLDAEPVRSVYVGDSLPWDIGGANGAGMISVWLNRSGAERRTGDPVPHAEIRSLCELPELLRGLPT